MNIGRPKDLEKRKSILDAAKNLFLMHGYHGSSMNQIAAEAQVSKLTVYNHFQDKDTLFTCAIEETCKASIDAHAIILNTQSDFRTALYQVCELALSITNLPEAIKLEHLLLELAAERNPLAQRFYEASHARIFAVWTGFFQQAHQLNLIKQHNVEQQTQLLLSLLLGHRHHEVLLGVRAVPTPEECQQIIQETIEIFILKYPPVSKSSYN